MARVSAARLATLLAVLVPALVQPAALLEDHTLGWAAAGLSTEYATTHLGALPPALFESLQDAVSRLLAAKEKQGSLKHGKGTTWWLPLGPDAATSPAPRSVVEVAIHHFFRLAGFGVAGAQRPPIVGAEWWIQDRGATDGIGYHYDKDEAYASLHMTMRFPEVSTVTYLSSAGGPTFIVNQTTPDGNLEIPELPDAGWLSYPEENKHLLFRGNLQHGVAEQLAAVRTGRRTTLLVNWWRERPQPPNVVDLETSKWRDLGLLLDASKARQLAKPTGDRARGADLLASGAQEGGAGGAWKEMQLVSGSTQRMSFEIAPTDMYFYEVQRPSIVGNWRVNWPPGFSLGPIARLDLEHSSCVSSLFREPKPKLIIVLADAGGRHWAGQLPKWLPDLFAKHSKRFKFVLADPAKTADFMRVFQLSAADAPTVVIHDTSVKPEGKHVLPAQPATAGGSFRKKFVWRFVADFLERTAPRRPKVEL